MVEINLTFLLYCNSRPFLPAPSMFNILVVDDDPNIQIFLARALSKTGYRIIVASNGEEGLKLAKETHPALIICDWMMPGVNGLEVCRQIKNTPKLATTFFILLTSLVSVEDRVKGLDAGADDFLCKPIEINELRARVRSGLRLHQLSDDLRLQKQLLELELSEAADYVRSILPEPIQSTPINIDFRFLPSRQLGGDGFDYYWLDSSHLAIYLLDVAGHGLRAALPSLSVINLLRSRSLSQVDYYQPDQVLGALNQTFQITQRNDKYFTIWYGVYDVKTHELTYASAGHPPAIMISATTNGEIKEERLKTPGFPIGMFLESAYTNQVRQIPPLSHIYLFSDGIYEIEQPNGKIWGLEKFIQLLMSSYRWRLNNLDDFIEHIKGLQINRTFDDDLSIMKISFVDG
ncbi:MAG: Regulator of RpoS [Chroococcopsis gigantea SAG 12.99]|jgi:sigma-B regulation protein RsbU (phosphoserine phosphatase)|nr:Regulator of RpoS [Chroococcopsis gigantea SAG 12.99]